MTTRVPVNMLRVGTERAQRAGVHVSTLAEITHQQWREQASCAGLDPTWWDPSEGSHTRADRARWAVAVDVCNHCPVQAACAADAGRPDVGSVRGGMMMFPDGRLRRVPGARPSPPPRPVRKEQVNLAACGTEKAKKRHRRRGEKCVRCRVAGRVAA